LRASSSTRWLNSSQLNSRLRKCAGLEVFALTRCYTVSVNSAAGNLTGKVTIR